MNDTIQNDCSSCYGKVAQRIEQRKHHPIRFDKVVHSNVNDKPFKP